MAVLRINGKEKARHRTEEDDYSLCYFPYNMQLVRVNELSLNFPMANPIYVDN